MSIISIYAHSSCTLDLETRRRCQVCFEQDRKPVERKLTIRTYVEGDELAEYRDEARISPSGFLVDHISFDPNARI